MVKYSFALKLPGSNQEYKYARDLNTSQENSPESVFNAEIRSHMRSELEKKSGCKIDDQHLSRMIKTWTQDIKEGYRETSMTLDLPSLMDEKLSQLYEPGNQEIPNLVNIDLSSIQPRGGALPPLVFC